MVGILAKQSAEMRTKGESLIQQTDLLCESWDERINDQCHERHYHVLFVLPTFTSRRKASKILRAAGAS
jgi:hypothetical protein